TDQFGNPGATFSANYTVDIGTVPYPIPLTSKAPLGSLVYDPTATGFISPAGDTATFTLAVDPAQTVTALVRATVQGLQPAAAWLSPSSASLGSATAAAAGQPALLQTVPATVGGVYQIVISGAGGTTGGYSVQVTLNAAQENEGVIAGVDNNS